MTSRSTGNSQSNSRPVRNMRAEPHDLAHVVADGRVAIAALLALDELRVDVAADDGAGRDLEIVRRCRRAP